MLNHLKNLFEKIILKKNRAFDLKSEISIKKEIEFHENYERGLNLQKNEEYELSIKYLSKAIESGYFNDNSIYIFTVTCNFIYKYII